MELSILTLSLIILWNGSGIFDRFKNWLIPVDRECDGIELFFQTVIHCPPCSSFYIAAFAFYSFTFFPAALVFATVMCAFIHMVYWAKGRFNL